MSGGGAGVAARLESILGPGRVASGDETRSWSVGGALPAAAAFPESPDEVREVMVAAAAEGWSVVPAGLGLSLGAGEPCQGVDVVLSTRRMDRMVLYEPADLTVSVEAGVSLEVLEGRTAAEGQWLPMEPPGHPSSTLGGAVAWGLGDALATSFGRPRDLVLGLTCVSGDGRILRLGGRVVKNVAGFDLLKLLVGSQGTLGVITEVTVRLYPRPEAEAFLVARSDDPGELAQAARAVATAPVLPASVELGHEARSGSGSCALLVRLQGNGDTVAAEARILQVVAPALGREDGPGARAVAGDFRGLEERSAMALRLALPPDGLGDGLGLLGRWSGGSEGGWAFVADPVTGVIRVGMSPEEEAEPAVLASRLAALRQDAEERGGSLTLTQAPPDLMGLVGARGTLAPGVRRIQRGLKESFDPSGTLSPGRLGS